MENGTGWEQDRNGKWEQELEMENA